MSISSSFLGRARQPSNCQNRLHSDLAFFTEIVQGPCISNTIGDVSASIDELRRDDNFPRQHDWDAIGNVGQHDFYDQAVLPLQHVCNVDWEVIDCAMKDGESYGPASATRLGCHDGVKSQHFWDRTDLPLQHN